MSNEQNPKEENGPAAGVFTRFFRWLFSCRIMSRWLFALACLATLTGLFYAVENWRGKRAWEQCRRELEAKGAVLDWNAYIPAPVPDEQNFAMTPIGFTSYGWVLTRDGKIIDARFPPHVSLAGDQDALVGSTLRELAQRFPQLKGRPVEEVHEALARVVQAAEPVTLEFSLDVGQGEQHFEARVAASGEAEAIIVARETTAKKRVQEAQRHEILLKEIHHRVKNNLQVISSLLSLQATSARDERVRSLLDESRHRVRSVALIHERLYRGGTVGTGYAQYVRDLADQLVRFYKGESGQVRIDIDVDDIPMDMDMSVPVGLIINELLTNSLAHAFPKDRHGSIRVSMKRAGGGRIEIGISDDGVGFPPEIDYRNPSSLGLRIVNMLAQQLKATLEVDGRDGTRFRVLFPAD